MSKEPKSEFEVEDFMDGLDDWFEEFTNEFEFDSVLSEPAQLQAKPIIEAALTTHYMTPGPSSDVLSTGMSTPGKQYPVLLPKQHQTPSALHQLQENQHNVTFLPKDFTPTKLVFKKVPKRFTGHVIFYSLYTEYFKQKLPHLGKREFGKTMAKCFKYLVPEQKSIFDDFAKKLNDKKIVLDQNNSVDITKIFLIEKKQQPTPKHNKEDQVDTSTRKNKKKRKRDLIPENYVCKMTFGNVPVKRRRMDMSSEGSELSSFRKSEPDTLKSSNYLSSDVPDVFSEFKEENVAPSTPIKPITLSYGEVPTTPTLSKRSRNIFKTPIKDNTSTKTMQTVFTNENDSLISLKSVFTVNKATQVSPIKPKVLVPRKYKQFGSDENDLK